MNYNQFIEVCNRFTKEMVAAGCKMVYTETSNHMNDGESSFTIRVRRGKDVQPDVVVKKETT